MQDSTIQNQESIKNEDWLHIFYENVEDYAIFLLDLEGNVATWNKGAARVFGYAAEEIVGKTGALLWVPEDRVKGEEAKERSTAAAKGKAQDERWHLRKGGERFYGSGILKAIEQEPGSLTGFVKIVRDLTQQKEMEDRLRASESHFHQLADAMPQIAFTARPDGYVDYFNKKWFEYSGFTAEQTYVPDGWAAILHPDDASTIPRWYEIVQSGQPFEAEERYKDRATGNYRWFLRRALPVRDDSGRVIRWFGTATDITQQKETELVLAQTKDQLRKYAAELEQKVSERTSELNQSVQSMEGILYHVAHDLRAPLRAMHGFTEIMLRQCSSVLDAEGADFGRRVSEAAERMDTLIQDLLTYGRLARPELPIHKVDLEREVRMALSLLEAAIGAAQAKVDVEWPLPSVMANNTLLGEIIINLITNGMKFVAPGVIPHIRLSAQKSGGRVRFNVRDNGIGIAPEHQQKVFGMFERLHDRRTYPGTGVGLAIVAKGVERMGGKVGVESKPGEGSCFWFELPEAK